MIGLWRRVKTSARVWLAPFAVLSAFQAEILTAAPASPEPPSRFTVRWVPDAVETNRIVVEVSGLSNAMLQELRQANWTASQWQRLLAIYVEQGEALTDIGLPAMLGGYRVGTKGIRFEPQFALAPGVSYRALFHPDQLPGTRHAGQPLSSVFKLTPRRAASTTVVSRIYPSADVLPENLLKFYVHFSAPMSGGRIYDHIHLRDEAGKAVELPFLEIDEELWNPAMTRLTLFIDPGRIKRGVQPLEEIGPALEEGKRYTLAIDRDWKDADGLPLKESFRKMFRVGPPARAPLDAAKWKISTPRPGSLDALVIRFPAPLDHALALRMIRVARGPGEALDGTASLDDDERRWKFAPAQQWQRGPHQLLVQTTIEDLAGNNVGKSFEVDLFDNVDHRITNPVATIAFEVK